MTAAAIAPPARPRPRPIAAWRLNVLRLTYLLLVVGLGLQVWPGMVRHHADWPLMDGVVQCMLGAMALLAALGLRHPLRMLPLLLFEIAWKVIWLSVVAAPKWASGQMDPDTASVTFACSLVVIFLVAMPWRHVADALVLDRGDRWL